MKVSDELLLAYVDNELDAATRAEVDAAIASDPELARRLEQQRSLRKLLGAAYDPALDEAVPARPLDAAQARPRARVVELASARRKRPDDTPARSARGWPAWAGMAAALVLGLVAGRLVALPGDDVGTSGGRLVARGELAQALSVQLAATQSRDARVRVPASYLSRSGEYCRGFTLERSGAGGVACRRGNDWVLQVLAPDRPASSGPAGQPRSAGPSLPPAALRVIDEQAQSPLDARGEEAAQRAGWRPPS